MLVYQNVADDSPVLVVRHIMACVDFINPSSPWAMELVSWPNQSFNRIYKKSDMKLKDVIKQTMATLKQVGADQEVLDALAEVTTITKDIITMSKKPAVKVAPVKDAKVAPVKGVAAPAPKLEAPAPKPKVVRNSAAAMFKSLIMAGELNDNEIFSAVQQEFDLDDSKRNYVGWYRNWLKKHGEEIPPVVQGSELPKKVKAPKPAPAAKTKPADIDEDDEDDEDDDEDGAPAKKAPAKKAPAPVEDEDEDDDEDEDED